MKRALLLSLILALMVPAVTSCKSKAKPEEEKAYLGEGEIAEELPITRVALYQNGVGYFERRGTVDGDVITLRIRPDQINDILKSLTVIDLGDGRPISISLPVDKQAVDQLAAIPEQIRYDGGVLALLSAFRGARVKLIADSTIEGRVVGLENMPVEGENGRVDAWSVTIKDASGRLNVVQVDKITALDIQDKTLEVGLEKSLDISLNEGSWKPIELKVRMSNAKSREVLVSYIVSMPVWKPAYRMVLGDGEESGEGLFQGWAVVDNVSGSNWDKVRMSLVAGTPMSFVYDLYSPHFISRPDLTHRRSHVAMAPTVETAAVAAAAPRTSGKKSVRRERAKSKSAKKDKGGWGDYDESLAAADGIAVGGSAGYGGYGLADSGDVWEESEEEMELAIADYEGNFESQGQGEEISALFQYDVDAPVTVPDRSSALVNLVQAKGQSQEVVLFRPELWTNYDSLSPYRAVELHNESGFDLEPGPITLYKSGTFIGEGFLSRTEKDAVAFVTFAMDPQVNLKTRRAETEEAARIMKIHGGYIESEVKQVTTVTYEIRNTRDEEVRTVIRRPVRANYSLDPKPEGVLEAAGAYYIPFAVPAGETKTFEIRETTPVRRTYTLDSTLALDLLKVELSDASLDPELKKSLQDVVEKKAQLDEVQAELADLRTQKSELENEAWRLTSSLEDIKDIKDGPAKDLRKQLVKRASEVEKRIGEKSTRIAELSLQESDLDRTLRALFRSVTFEAKPEKAQE